MNSRQANSERQRAQRTAPDQAAGLFELVHVTAKRGVLLETLDWNVAG